MAQRARLQRTGPFVSAAFICEKVLTENDGVSSFVRVIDRVIHQAVGPEAPENMPPFTMQATLVIFLRAGKARGRFSLVFRLQDPTMEWSELGSSPVEFQQEEDLASLKLPLVLSLAFDGLYWIDVLLKTPNVQQDPELLTRVALRVLYRPIQTSVVPPPGG